MNQQYLTSIHPFNPVFDESSKILILGSHPSVKSIQEGFYYMNKTNRFWRILSQIYKYDFITISIKEKIKALKQFKIALYDVVYQCDIINSSDASIKNVVPVNLDKILTQTNITKIILNGKQATNYFNRYFQNVIKTKQMEIITLPSTSAANARFSLEQLLRVWYDALIN